MKRKTAYIAVALLTFIIGVTFAMFQFIPVNPILSNLIRSLASNSTYKQKLSAPAGWRKKDIGSHLTIYLPPGMYAVKVNNLDPLEGSFGNRSLHGGFISAGYYDGMSVKWQSKQPEYQESEILVEGGRAYIRSYYDEQIDRWIAVAHFTPFGRLQDEGSGIVMGATCEGKEELELAKRIFSFVEFR